MQIIIIRNPIKIGRKKNTIVQMTGCSVMHVGIKSFRTGDDLHDDQVGTFVTQNPTIAKIIAPNVAW